MTQLLLALLFAAGPAGVEIADPLSGGAGWQLGGRRINYTLGASSLSPSTEQSAGGAPTLKLSYDFAELRRDYLSAYYTGEPLAGYCRNLSFQLFGNGSGLRLRLSLEDARGRWFQRDAGTVTWQGWARVEVPVGDGAGWRTLVRQGEDRLPLLQPVALREIACYRARADQPNGVIWLRDLAAERTIEPADRVTAQISTGRGANLFELGERPTLTVTLHNPGERAVAGRLNADVTDGYGQVTTVPNGDLALAPGAREQRTIACPISALGAYEVAVRLRTAQRERQWPARFAITQAAPARPADPRATFGACGDIDSIATADLPTAFRLDRDAGLRWARLGFYQTQMNPARGVWAWDSVQRVPGPLGHAVRLSGQGLQLAHIPALDCPGGVTIAFWAKVAGANGSWQWPVSKLGAFEADRAYGVFFAQRDGRFHFSAGFSKLPTVGHVDIGAPFSAWDGQWHHYAASYSPAARRVVLYVDGKQLVTRELDGGPLRTNSGPLSVGSALPGQLDEVLLYGRALTPDEVAALAGKQAAPSDGMVAGWSCDDDGPRLRDRSGHGLDLVAAEPPSVQLARLGREHGLSTLGILGFPAAWASTAPEGAARPYVYKPDLPALAEYVERTVRQYRGLVDHWEFWNEPNITVFWEPQPNAKDYAAVLAVAYQAAKRGNPDCTMLMPGLAGPHGHRERMEFLDEAFGLGGAGWCDAVSIHPYRQSTPEASDLTGELAHIAAGAAADGRRRPIWFTEMCWTNELPSGSSEARTALLLPRCYALSLGSGLVEKLIWFRLHDPGVDRFYSEHNYGLCYADLTPKPAYFAHRAFALLLDGARPDGTWDVGPRAMARCFRTAAERVAVVWSPAGTAPAAIYTGLPSVTCADSMGNERQIPTVDGVLLLDAGESVTYLRHLPGSAEGRGTPLAVSAPTLVRGAAGALTVALRNPFARALPVTVTVDGPPALRLGQRTVRLELAAAAAREVSLPLAAAAEAEPGWQTVTVHLDLAGRRFTQTTAVGLRSAAPDAGPVARWHLDEGQGERFADTDGQHPGSSGGARWVPGHRGTALEFDGRGQAVIADTPDLNRRDEVTVACWLKLLADTGTWQFPVTKYFQENIRRNWGFYITPGTLRPAFSASFERGGAAHNDFVSETRLPLGQWVHLAASYSMFDQRVRLYVAGRPAGEWSFDGGRMLLTSDPMRLGTGTRGVIDEVTLWPRALSAEEVGNLAGG